MKRTSTAAFLITTTMKKELPSNRITRNQLVGICFNSLLLKLLQKNFGIVQDLVLEYINWELYFYLQWLGGCSARYNHLAAIDKESALIDNRIALPIFPIHKFLP